MVNNPRRDFYEVLDISKDSSREEIRKAYRVLVKKWHPDKHPVSSKQEAEARFKAITEAYEAVNDDDYRNMFRLYSDMASACPGTESSRPAVLLREEEVKAAAAAAAAAVAAAGTVLKRKPPVEKELECTLEELCWGCKKEVKVSRNIVIGTGMVFQKPHSHIVSVKPGWKKDTRITYEGIGGEADLIFSIKEKKHPLFKRVGDDLVLKLQVSLVDALVGRNFSFSLLGGKKMSCSFDDEVVFPGHEKVIKGQGMPITKGKGRGDLKIKFQIVFPRKLSKEQQLGIAELLRA